jgi:O-antigen/teichoic acid export membrane protein
MKGVNNVVSGTLWTAAGSTIQAVIQILRLSILARFLEKSDFGLVAIVVLILGFTQIFTDLGISVSLYSRHDITRKEYSSLYWVSLIISIFLYGAIFLLSPLIAGFYMMPQLSLLVPIMSLDLIIGTAGRQFRISLQKRMKFKTLALIDIMTNALSLLLAFVIAYKEGGIWSIIYSNLFASFASSLLLIIVGSKSYPLSMYVNLKEGRSFYKIGIYQTGSQILDYVASQMDILIIGKLMGTTELGVYNLIKQLVVRIYSLLNPIISRVSVPILAQLNNDLSKLKIKYLQMLKLTSFVNFLIYGLLALLAKEVLAIMYGEAYESSFYILQIFCIWGSITSIMSSASGIIAVTGRTDLGFRWTLIRIVSNPIFVLVGYQYGFLGIVLAQAMYSLIFYNVYWKLVVNKTIRTITFKEYLLSSLKCAIYSLTLFCIFGLVKNAFEIEEHVIILNLAVFGSAFSITYFLLNQNIVKNLKDQYYAN